MKIFEYYNPVRIARYVKAFFRGRLYIRGVGLFEFDQGRLQLPQPPDRESIGVISEVNRQISRLRTKLG